MKKSKILAPALAILCLSTAASVTGTVAWFASNNIVSATGMNVHANLPSSLVIADTIAHLSTRSIALDYASSATSLSPCTITSDDALPTDTVGTLQTIDSVNGGEIDQATGLPTAGTIVYKAATNGLDYVEYISYIASAGASIVSGYTLTAQIMNSRVGLTNTLKATSISFYVTPIDDSETYRGTLNLANLDAQKNDFTTEKTSVSIFTSTADGVIGTYNDVSGKALKIRMVVYFDGALLRDATHAFVASFDGDPAEVNLDVDFTGIYA